MRYLVTGGAGFIGSHLVEHLLSAGDHVVVLDDFSSGTWANVGPFRDRIDLIEGSITDLETCRAATQGVDVVLHQAAIASVIRSVEEPLATHAVNVTGTINVMLAARDGKVRRIVFASSTAVYGDVRELPVREDMLPSPLSPYAATKLAVEDYCQAFGATYGLETVVLRYFNVFGPRQDPNSQYAAAIPKFIVAALAGDAPTIFGDGEQTRDFVFVGDVVQANLLASRAPAAQVAGRVFNIGTGRAVTVNELWRRIQEIVRIELPPRHAEPRAGEIKHSYASIERARRCLGYAPAVDFEEGLLRTVRSYEARSGTVAQNTPPTPGWRGSHR
ncbi:MAG TPA: SDR family oxidoreductase [Gemmatimonadales bacterium]|nr:SDR family oxidoreductase [Gemmatimonadales bacterium]